MKPSRIWDFLFVYSNYHAEHHYFQNVPFYNLRELHMRLRPLYDRLGVKRHTYREIVWQWFVLNRAPHTDWEKDDNAPTGPSSPAGNADQAGGGPAAAHERRVAARVATS
jgi:fatty acid desaturase